MDVSFIIQLYLRIGFGLPRSFFIFFLIDKGYFYWSNLKQNKTVTHDTTNHLKKPVLANNWTAADCPQEKWQYIKWPFLAKQWISSIWFANLHDTKSFKKKKNSMIKSRKRSQSYGIIIMLLCQSTRCTNLLKHLTPY